MPDSSQKQTILLGLLGAAIGGCIGYFAFFWAVRQGYFALVAPGGLLGIGAGFCARRRCVPLGVICGVAALLLGIFTAWRFSHPVANPGFTYFLTHIHSLDSITLIMIAAGAVVGFSAGLGRNRAPAP